MSTVTRQLEEMSDAMLAHIKKRDDEIASLTDRLEVIEANRGKPKGAGADRQLPYQVFFSRDGKKQFAVPSNVKIADIPELAPAKKSDVSLERWLGAIAAGENCRDEEAKNFARQMKALETTTSGILIPTEYQGQWIDLIRAQMVLNTAGMQTVPMNDKSMTWSAVTGDSSVTWHAEAGAITASNPTFAARTLTAKTAVIRAQATLECAQDSPDFGNQLAAVLTKAIAVELDRAGLHGASNGPTGIYSTSNVTVTTGVGTPTDYTDITGAVKTLLDNNVSLDVATRYAIMNPRTWLTYEDLVTGISSDKTPLQRPPSLRNTQFLTTTNVSTALDSPAVSSAIFMGDFSKLIMGNRMNASVEIVKADSYVGNLVLDFIAYARVDFLVTVPTAFVVLDGVTSS